jgi:hypothetical protein
MTTLLGAGYEQICKVDPVCFKVTTSGPLASLGYFLAPRALVMEAASDPRLYPKMLPLT